MTVGRLAKGLVALSVAGAAVLGAQVPALAQQQGPPSDRPCGQGNGNPPQYPPGQQKRGSINDSTPARGQQVTATSGPNAFDPGSRARACFHSTPVDLGLVTVDSNGAATVQFSVPRDAAIGRHFVSFNGVNQGQPSEVDVPLTVVASGAGGVAPGQSGSRLPRTGADQLVPLTVLGGSLVLAGAGVVVAARRRREDSLA